MRTQVKLLSSAFENVLPLDVRQRRVAMGTQALVGDPYWMLARQWQMGEFKGSNAGTPLQIDVAYRTSALGATTAPTSTLPLQVTIESVGPALDHAAAQAPAGAYLESHVDVAHLAAPDHWVKDRMEYTVEIHAAPLEAADTGTTRLLASEYRGGVLDWHDFRIDRIGEAGWSPPIKDTVRPTQVTFAGMPRSRYWEYEDHDVTFSDLTRPGNFLSVLLLEFGLLYSNDWFIVPLQQRVNTLRRIDAVTIHDVFGVTIEARAHGSTSASTFQQFALDHQLAASEDPTATTTASSQYLLLPDAMARVHAGEPIEKVVFFRDETANLVWGIEQVVDGVPVAPSAEGGESPVVGAAGAEPSGDGRLRYVPLRLPARNHIPFVPAKLSSPAGQMRLRRGRTVTDPFIQQFRTELVRDSVALREEEIPGHPIAVAQKAYLACLTTEDPQREGPFKYHLWVARRKDASENQPDGKLRFDALERVAGSEP